MPAHELVGRSLGTRRVSYDDRDVILYALAVGARADELDLVFERNLRVLPTFALPLGLWAPDVLGEMGAFDVPSAVHGGQSLTVHAPLPVDGGFDLHGRVDAVWDKGRAAIFDLTVSSEYFHATYSIFAPGAGGFGGPRGSKAVANGNADASSTGPPVTTTVSTYAEQAALYRLTGDRHLIHILPQAAHRIGQPRPIMHGLCTLAASVLGLARATGAHPAGLRELSGRFTAPVLPGQVLDVNAQPVGEHRYDVQVDVAGQAVITAGRIAFGAEEEGMR